MTLPHPPRLIVVTGIMASGKSSVAQRLAERLDRSVHLRGDTFRTMIVNGRVELDLPPSDEAWRQVLLRYRIAEGVAAEYLAAGFDVVYQDVMLGPALAAIVRSLVRHDLHVVVLTPRAEVVAERDAQREKDAYTYLDPAEVDRVLREETPRIGLWIDDSEKEVDETVDLVLERLEDARVVATDLRASHAGGGVGRAGSVGARRRSPA